MIAEGCKRLIENAIICWNYLYLSQKIAETPEGKQREDLLAQIKDSSVVTWHHVNLHGEFDFSEEKLKGAIIFHITKIIELKVI